MNGQAPYEQADVSIKGIVLFAIVLTIVTAFVFVLMGRTYDWFEARARAAEQNVTPASLVPQEGPRHPPGPVLQGAPGSRFELRDPLPEMREMREQEDYLLETAGWIDEDAGRVRLPIETAKQRLLERGLPARPAPAEADAR